MRRARPEIALASPAKSGKRQAFGNWDTQFTSKSRCAVSPSRPHTAFGGLSATEVEDRFMQINTQATRPLRRRSPAPNSPPGRETSVPRIQPIRAGVSNENTENFPPFNSPSRQMRHKVPSDTDVPRLPSRKGLMRPSPPRRNSNTSTGDERWNCNPQSVDLPGEIPIIPQRVDRNRTIRRAGASPMKSRMILHNLPKTKERLGFEGAPLDRITSQYVDDRVSATERILPESGSSVYGSRAVRTPSRARSDSRGKSSQYGSAAETTAIRAGNTVHSAASRNHPLRHPSSPAYRSPANIRSAHRPVGTGSTACTLSADTLARIGSELVSIYNNVEDAVLQCYRPSSQDTRHLDESQFDLVIENLVASTEWSDQMKVSHHLEGVLDEMANIQIPGPCSDRKLSKQISVSLVDALLSMINSPRSHVSKRGLCILYKFFVVKGDAIMYTMANVDTLAQVCLKKSQDHVNQIFIVNSAKRAFFAWVLFSPLQDVKSGFDRIIGSSRIPNATMAICGLLLYLTRQQQEGDLFPLCRAIVPGLKTMAERGKKTDRELAEYALFMVLIAGNRGNANSRGSAMKSPIRPSASIPTNVTNLCGKVDCFLKRMVDHTDNHIIRQLCG